MIVTLDSKRRLTVPKALVKTRPGEHFEALYDVDEDKIVLHRVKRKEDWLEVLKQCPSSMDDLPPRSRERSKDRKL
jgi:bifunctional DNA-binding transcriptional regulator/antitoxin component of YhaV-PrlF toxin-antitoxin module